jgi:hypothetical protein
MPSSLLGLDVVIGPGVALSGEGVPRFPTFGSAVALAIGSVLQRDGFELVAPDRAQAAVRVAIQANLEVVRSRHIIINGRPMESNAAHVVVQVLSPDGRIVDAFQVEGDPEDADTPNKVAAEVVEHMKGSDRLMTFAKAGPRTAAAPPVAATAPSPSGAVSPVTMPPTPPPARSSFSPALGNTTACDATAINAAPDQSSGHGPEVADIRVGMTRDEVVTICCPNPRAVVHERYASTGMNGEEQTVPAGTSREDLLEEPYLAGIICGSKAGMTQIRFAPPPAKNRVLFIHNTTKGIQSSPEAYLASLFKGVRRAPRAAWTRGRRSRAGNRGS